MVDDGNDDDVARRIAASNCVQKPPESGEVFHVKVVDAVSMSKCARNSVPLDDLAVEAVRAQNGSEAVDSASD
ncbi:MAG: hypothetical protein E6K18_03135 [Methanobacteriota archaeon]|nr:MAG: hypothetical protein E6K18_03135 [Euryarchaeota archaeon]